MYIDKLGINVSLDMNDSSGAFWIYGHNIVDIGCIHL